MEKQNKLDIGNKYQLSISDNGEEKIVQLYHLGSFIKQVNFNDRVEKRLFITELVELGANQTKVSNVLSISRQSIHNYVETKKYFGLEGLINNYNPSISKDRTKQRKINIDNIQAGNTAKKLAEIRKEKKEEAENANLNLNFAFEEEGSVERIPASEQPYCKEHKWEATRYAGIMLYVIVLTTKWRWFELVIGLFGRAYKIFSVFLLMVARNIRSIEQLKNVRLDEAGAILGIKRIPTRNQVWEWFYDASEKMLSRVLLFNYFLYQLKAGLVSIWAWFTDGHLLPYSGKEKVHHSYNTQRRMPMPGRTNIVTCDISGRIVDFEIQEGKGDLKERIKKLSKKWEEVLPKAPVMVFDREGYGIKYFFELVRSEILFVTWDKYVDTKKLGEIEEERFTEHFEVNGKEYSIFEEEETYIYIHEDENGEKKEYRFELRVIYLWNRSTGRRTRGLAWTGSEELSSKDCAYAILSRWGASENTFKHCGNRHPLHYHPGFKLEESENQDIANPLIKEKEKLIKQIKNNLKKLYKKVSKAFEATNKDGTVRKNSKKENLQRTIDFEEARLKKLSTEKQELPQRVDVSNLENYRSFKQIDNEGKNLFDFVTSSVWNARKEMVDMLVPFFKNRNEVVDLFYAITECHGWIKSTKTKVTIRLEPMQQLRRRLAQEKLCRRVTGMCAQTLGGKYLEVEVGSSPL